MFRLANRVLFFAVAGVLVALVSVVALASDGMYPMLIVVVLAPVCLAPIVLERVIGRVVQPRWIELDCLPLYPTRNPGE